MILKVSSFLILGLFVGLHQTQNQRMVWVEMNKIWSWKEDKKQVVWFTVQVTPSVAFIYVGHTWSHTVPQTWYHWRCCLWEEMYSLVLTSVKPAEAWGHCWEQKAAIRGTCWSLNSTGAYHRLGGISNPLTSLISKMGEGRRWKGFVRKMK